MALLDKRAVVTPAQHSYLQREEKNHRMLNLGGGQAFRLCKLVANKAVSRKTLLSRCPVKSHEGVKELMTENELLPPPEWKPGRYMGLT